MSNQQRSGMDFHLKSCLKNLRHIYFQEIVKGLDVHLDPRSSWKSVGGCRSHGLATL